MNVDSDLLASAAAGDHEAAGRLIEEIWPDAYRIALMVTGSPHTAEDASQEACIQMLKALPGLRHPRAFRAWFYRLVTRSAYRELKNAGREEPVEAPPDRSNSGSQHGDLRAALASLGVKERLNIILHYYYGFNSSEIASISGSAPGTVRYHLWRARIQLKALLLDERGDFLGDL